MTQKLYGLMSRQTTEQMETATCLPCRPIASDILGAARICTAAVRWGRSDRPAKIMRRLLKTGLLLAVAAIGTEASAQTAETVGTRALGMGGAFVAVASDSSAAWWNPAGIAAGPFIDGALGRARLETTHRLPASRENASWFAVATPPVGISYYRFRITDIQPFDPTGADNPDRQDGRAGVTVRSLAASHLGLTLVQTLLPGVHAGATLKYVRGTLHAAREDNLAALDVVLDRGDALEDGNAESRFDMDVGVLAVAGALRLGARMRNVLEPEFSIDRASASEPEVQLRLPRQTRVGMAIDGSELVQVPFTVALDVDVNRYAAPSGLRRVVALGVEQWLWNERVGVRGGVRMNTEGARERAATAGASFAVRPGFLLEGHVVRGREADERGWGLATRVSF
jgi:F plasmid transfer operon protein TraF